MPPGRAQTDMALEIIPGEGIGAIRFGMPAFVVLNLFHEKQQYEDWIDGNLNDSLCYHGLVFHFDACASAGPLPDAQLDMIEVHGRDDVTLFGRPIARLQRDDILRELRDRGYDAQEMPNGCVVVQSMLELCFAGRGGVKDVCIYRAGTSEAE